MDSELQNKWNKVLGAISVFRSACIGSYCPVQTAI